MVPLALALAAGCGAPTPPTPGPGVVLVVVDSLRRDHVSGYGYARATTPRLDRLAAQGVRYDRAVAQAPWTTPSVASLLTSRYPSEVGIRHEAHLAQGPLAQEQQRRHVQSLEHRVQAHVLAAMQGCLQATGAAIDQGQVDLRGRDADAGEEIRQGGGVVQGHLQLPLAPFGTQMIVELRVAAQAYAHQTVMRR